MLDWSKIDNEKTLQRLVNHLFALECNSPGFIPSSPYIGADGGWDGRFDGFYPLEQERGVWSIQSKWTTKSFTKAVSSLKPEIKEELKKAKHNKVDHLRIATNAELKVDEVRELQGLNEGEVTSLLVWHREELTRRIELQPFLRHYFFGSPQHLKFVPWNIYFNDIETGLLNVPATRISKFEEYLGRARFFITSKTHNILLIHSPGGYGKSHLLREIAQIAHLMDHTRQIWMTRAGFRTMEDSLQDEVIHGRNYLLVLDDADRCLEEIKPLLSFCKYNRDSVKVILASRTSAAHMINEIVNQLRVEEIYDESNISSWDKDDLINLLRIVTGQDKVDDEEMIASSYPNPFLMVWIGKQIKKEPALALDKLKEKFVNDLDYDSHNCLQQFLNQSQTRKLLKSLACVVPFYRNSADVLKELGGEIGLDPDKIAEAIDVLVKAGVLRTVGRSVRFNPDMKGDLYLAYELEKESDIKNIEKLINTWTPISADNLFSNFGAATGYAKVPALEKIFSGIIKSWINDAEKSSSDERRRVLNLVEKILHIVSDDCLNLLSTYLQVAPPTGDHLSLTTDHYGPIVLKLLGVPNQRVDVLELIEKIESKGIEGTYSNYQPTSLISDSVSPLENGKDVIQVTLDLFSSWTQEPNAIRTKLVSAALGEVLAGSHKFTKSRIKGITFGHRMLKDTKDVRGIRDKALMILKAMLTSHDLDTTLSGIQVAEEIGEGGMGISEKEMPLKEKIASERKEILDCIAELVSPDTNIRLLNAIEDLLLKWWAQQKPGTEESNEILRKFPRAPEYRFTRYFISPDYVMEDFGKIESQAPSDDRWRWFVDNVMRITAEPDMEEFKRLAEVLSGKYPTKENIGAFLLEAEKTISPHQPWANPPIVGCWVDINPDVFSFIRADQGLWGNIPERFRNEIDFALSGRNEKLIQELADEILSELPCPSFSKMQTFLKILSMRPIEESIAKDWLAKLIEGGDSQTRAMIIFDMSTLGKKFTSINPFEMLLLAVSREGTLGKPMLHNLSFTVRRLQKEPQSIQRKGVRDFRDELLKKMKDVPKLDWDGERLLDFCLKSIEATIDFLSHRLATHSQMRMKGATSREYEGVPFRGLECVAHQVRSYEDFEKLMDQLMKWQQEGDPWQSYDVQFVMKPLTTLSCQGSGKLFLEKYIEEQIGADSVVNALEAAEHLPFNEKTTDVVLQLCEKAIELGKVDPARGLLDHLHSPDTGWSSGLGEAPPALIERKNFFEKMYLKANPGRLRTMIKQCVQSVNRHIEEHIKSDEEFLSPRG